MQKWMRWPCLGVMLLAWSGLFSLAQAQETGNDKLVITVLPLPIRDIQPIEQDEVYASLARQLRTQYSLQVISGRPVSRAVWGTLGSGLEEAAMSFTKKVGDGKQAYQLLQLDKAFDALQDARRLEEICGPELRDASLLVDLHVYLGLVHMAKNEVDKAGQEFRMAIAHSPEFSLSTKQFPPDVVAVFEKSKSQLSARSKTMSFESKPSGANVFLDGKRLGNAPINNVSVLPGHHHVRFELEGFSLWTLSVPDGVTPPSIKALMVPLWTGPSPEDLTGMIAASEQVEEPTMVKLRSLAAFFGSDALLLLSLSRGGADVHLGIRLFVGQPELLTRAHLFNLGASRAEFDRKIQGVVSTLTQIRQAQVIKRAPSSGGSAVAIGNQPAGTNAGGAQGEGNVQGLNNGAIPTPGEGEGTPDGGTEEKAWYQTWWFWTITGVVVAGAATGLTVWLLWPEKGWTLVVQHN